MKSSTANQSRGAVQADADRLADFVLFTQRSCILNLSNELNRGNISFPQFFLLAYLSSEDYLTMSDIAKKMGHSTAAATGLVDRLEKLGYVERVHAAEDRRNFHHNEATAAQGCLLLNHGVEYLDKILCRCLTRIL